jgi:hypothetical protein
MVDKKLLIEMQRVRGPRLIAVSHSGKHVGYILRSRANGIMKGMKRFYRCEVVEGDFLIKDGGYIKDGKTIGKDFRKETLSVCVESGTNNNSTQIRNKSRLFLEREAVCKVIIAAEQAQALRESRRIVLTQDQRLFEMEQNNVECSDGN